MVGKLRGNEMIKKILLATIFSAILLGLIAATCGEPAKPTPTPSLIEVAPGAYLAPMTSAQLAQMVSNETGTGVLVYASSPSIWSPTFPAGPIFATISNTGTLTLPTSTDTLVGRNTTDTLTNKTLTTPAVTGTATFSTNILLATATMVSGGSGVLAVGDGTAPTSAITNAAQLYSASGTLKFMDSSGVTAAVARGGRGSTSLPVGDVTCSVTHSLGATPNQVFLSWYETAPVWAVATGTMWWSLPTSTVFTINLTMALSNRPTIAWLAVP